MSIYVSRKVNTTFNLEFGMEGVFFILLPI